MTTYLGTELEIFRHATNWKRYWSGKLLPYVSGKVLEVGSGIGGSIPFLLSDAVTAWHALEPDPDQAANISRDIDSRVIVSSGFIADVDDVFDTILYIDVLEHIEKDAEELDQAAKKLQGSGCLIVLSPAHPFLFSEFDRAIGHHRRYDEERLRQIAPGDLGIERTFYLDSVGMLASAANRYLLKQSQPGPDQIAFWDKVMVPCSRLLDPVLGYRLGKTIVAVWRKPA